MKKLPGLGSSLPNAGEGLGGEGDRDVSFGSLEFRTQQGSLAFEAKSPSPAFPPHLQLLSLAGRGGPISNFFRASGVQGWVDLSRRTHPEDYVFYPSPEGIFHGSFRRTQ